MVIQINKNFRKLTPPPSKEERSLLKSNIAADGLRDHLAEWNGLLIDWHNRYEICAKLGIGIGNRKVNRSQVVEWVICNKFGRRNMSRYF